MSIMILDISLAASPITGFETFFETTWIVWWFFAFAVVGRWCWSMYLQNAYGDHRHANWRNLYRIAILEHDYSKIAFRMEEAEAAILLELGAQLFEEDSTERIALQEAMNNLRSLRESYSTDSNNALIA